jgi:hypothetical protein
MNRIGLVVVALLAGAAVIVGSAVGITAARKRVKRKPLRRARRVVRPVTTGKGSAVSTGKGPRLVPAA